MADPTVEMGATEAPVSPKEVACDESPLKVTGLRRRVKPSGREESGGVEKCCLPPCQCQIDTR